MANKLELTWFGKDEPMHIEPRLLIENVELSNTAADSDTENILIHGDNLLALRALESKYAGQIKCIYIDPPYNTRQYGANYHMLNTIAEYKPFIPKGKTGLREYTRSLYCSTKDVVREFEQLLAKAKFRYIFLSYNNEGLMSVDQIKNIMSKFGRYDVVCKQYQRFKADKTENRNHIADSTTEYLHILEKI